MCRACEFVWARVGMADAVCTLSGGPTVPHTSPPAPPAASHFETRVQGLLRKLYSSKKSRQARPLAHLPLTKGGASKQRGGAAAAAATTAMAGGSGAAPRRPGRPAGGGRSGSGTSPAPGGRRGSGGGGSGGGPRAGGGGTGVSVTKAAAARHRSGGDEPADAAAGTSGHGAGGGGSSGSGAGRLSGASGKSSKGAARDESGRMASPPAGKAVQGSRVRALGERAGWGCEGRDEACKVRQGPGQEGHRGRCPFP